MDSRCAAWTNQDGFEKTWQPAGGTHEQIERFCST